MPVGEDKFTAMAELCAMIAESQGRYADAQYYREQAQRRKDRQNARDMGD